MVKATVDVKTLLAAIDAIPARKGAVIDESTRRWARMLAKLKVPHKVICKKLGGFSIRSLTNIVAKVRPQRKVTPEVQQKRRLRQAKKKEQDKLFKLLMKQKPLSSLRVIRVAAEGKLGSDRTVRRIRDRCNYVTLVRPHCPRRTAADAPRRLAFVNDHHGISWRKIVATDEARFDINERGRYQTVPNTKKGRAALQKKMRSNYPASVHLWAAIGVDFKELVIFPELQRQSDDSDGRGYFRVNAHEYQKRCVPHLKRHCGGGVNVYVIQDGAKAHSAKSTVELLDKLNIRFFKDWPARSPDLNPIEHLWSWLKQRVSLRNPQTRDELVKAIRSVWDTELTQDMVRRHLQSWTSAVAECMENKGL